MISKNSTEKILKLGFEGNLEILLATLRRLGSQDYSAINRYIDIDMTYYHVR